MKSFRQITYVSSVLGTFLLGINAPASAIVTTIDAANRGWIQPNGDTGGTGDSDSNFLTGEFPSDSDGEFRSWFQFSIPALSGPITSAQLILETAEVQVDQVPFMTLSITSLPSVFGFTDLGTGTVYGSRVYSAADDHVIQVISLTAAALTDISASELGTFGTSQRISAGASFGPDDLPQFLFGSSGGRASTRLQIETTVLAADFDSDNDVDGDDFLLWQAGYAIDAGGDADGDGDTDGDDFLLWQTEFTTAGGDGSTGTVPEPSAWMVALLIVSSFSNRRGRIRPRMRSV